MFKRFALLLMVFPLSSMVKSDFNSAIKAYENKDYASAFAEFKRLAELGDGPSQRNLAAMYANGVQVMRDDKEAWVWFSLAAEQDKSVEATRDKVFKRLPESDRASASQRLDDLRAQFGRDAINAKLMPVADVEVADCSVAVEGDASPLKTFPPRYPRSAAQNDIEGIVCSSFYVTADGRPAAVKFTSVSAYQRNGNARNGYADAFQYETREALKKWRFKPAATDALRKLPKKFCMDFKLATSDGFRAEKQQTEALVERFNANADDPETLYEMAKKIENNANQWHFAKKDDKALELRTTANQLFVRSAINGKADAQFRLASDLMTGNHCEKDLKKGLFWLTLAAQQGHAESQYLMYSRLLNGEGVQIQTDKAYEWLKAAAAGGHTQAKLEYALYLLRTDAKADVTAYLPEKFDDNHLVHLELMAQIAALRGEFDLAVTHQTAAVAIAQAIEVDTTFYQAQLNKFLRKEI